MDKELQNFISKDIPNEDLEIGDALGTGGFGTVYKAIRLSTSELLAVKEVRSDKLTLSAWASLYSEVATMAPLSQHKYVLELVGAHVTEPYRIITRFCSGKSLFDRLHRPNSGAPLTSQRLTAIACQVAEGMSFLHSNGIVHRDLKTMNILLDGDDIAKIADFGLAGMMKDNEMLFGGVGTPHYTAPEVLERKSYGSKVDIYSYGIILWEMAVRQIPYRDKSPQEIYDHVVNKGWRLPFTNNVPNCLKQIISRCWNVNPIERPDFDEIVHLFKSGKLYFNGSQNLNLEILESGKGCPPIDFNYLVSVLKDPSNIHFPSVVTFLEKNIDSKLKQRLRESNIIDNYNSDSPNPSSILSISTLLLENSELKHFVKTVADRIIQKGIESDDVQLIQSSIKFCLKIPSKDFKIIVHYIPDFISRSKQDDTLLFLVIRIFSRLPPTDVTFYEEEIYLFFTKINFEQTPDQETLESISILIPIISDRLEQTQINSMIGLIETDLNCPIPLIKYIIAKTKKETNVRLVKALIFAASHSNITECLLEVLQRCSDKDITKLIKNNEIFEQIQNLLKEKKSIDSSLLLLFYLLHDENVPVLLINHPIIDLVLQVKGHVAQRLQIFTLLFSSELFCSNTTISNSVIQLIISSLNIESLSEYSLKLIGALSLHSIGCSLINETEMLSLFSQMFLSSTCNDLTTQLLILTNLAKAECQIPEVSLIISCLMQELIVSTINRINILFTLIHLIKSSPNSVQEHDIQYAILPMLTKKQEPTINVLLFQLLDACDMIILRNVYKIILEKTFEILSNSLMMFPELLNAAIQLMLSLSTSFDLNEFFNKTNFREFVKDVKSQMEIYLNENEGISSKDKFESIKEQISNCSYILNQKAVE
ncbi:TKL family protein kinase [Histomonas meleagridis]|uniref:TKL family protein kinase n=1 Tax=Histomonas meleagridis TaxID=135588 RepID=UPI00355A9281|nr:TKL family protein kinase [Histomonas meleagridis]KAH0799749.1 TKL family protein kinase [Histomonas meleagridis]